jgi:hypothetical protein
MCLPSQDIEHTLTMAAYWLHGQAPSLSSCFGRQEMQYQPDGQRQKPNISTVDESYAHKVPGGILRTPSSCTKHPKMVLTADRGTVRVRVAALKGF